MRICIFEDTGWTDLSPLVHFRPPHHLRCGALTIVEKVSALFPGSRLVHHVRSSLREYLAELPGEAAVDPAGADELLFINGRMIPDEGTALFLRRRSRLNHVYRSGDAVAAARLDAAASARVLGRAAGEPLADRLFEEVPSEQIGARVLRYPWEYVHQCAEEIERDFKRMKGRRPVAGKVSRGAHILGRRNVIIGKGSVIQPGAVIDAQKGPVIIGRNVLVMPNAFIEGPAAIGDGSIVKAGAKVYHGTSVGERCKVGGEVESSIIQSYSNKQHEGFLGHSYLASWVNIGADTNTSDLKNTYGTVRVHTASGVIDTGLQFVGLTMGDHSKSGINVMFDTGTVVGVSCNVFGAGLPPKYIPSFSWGGDRSFTVYALDRGMETARRMMARRQVPFTAGYERLFTSAFAGSAGEREQAGIR